MIGGQQLVPAPDTTPPAATPTDPDDVPDDSAPDGDPAGQPCSASDVDALATVVQGQLDAIVEGSWEDALTWSTPGFRQDIDAERFAAIISDGFPIVAAAAATDLGRCVVATSGEEASMAVTVSDVDGAEQDLLYLFELGVDGWRIGGALPADGGADPDAGITV